MWIEVNSTTSKQGLVSQEATNFPLEEFSLVIVSEAVLKNIFRTNLPQYQRS
jgi:hypothetical protein